MIDDGGHRCFDNDISDPGRIGSRPTKLARSIFISMCTVEISGHPLSGSYAVEDGIVKVKTPYGEKATQVGSFNSEWVARRLLEELAAEGKHETEDRPL
jgi:hypothetical protein